MPFFDTHCHLVLPKLEPHTDAILLKCCQRGVTHLVSIALGPSPTELFASLELEERARGRVTIRTAAGIHPHNAKEATPAWYDLLERQRDRIVMVGEIGLDYHYNYSSPAEQQRVFCDQLDYARQHDLPVILHVREAHEECLCLLHEHPPKEGSILHCYTGDAPLAKRYLDLGFYISFSGVVTFKKATPIQEAARIVPLERLLVETDAPFLAPVPFRGKVCEPWHVVYTAAHIAQLKERPLAEVETQLFTNALLAFSLEGVTSS